MSFDELIDAILCEQDSVTHYNEEDADVPMRLHQKYRAEAVGALRDWVKAQVAAEREACARMLTRHAGYKLHMLNLPHKKLEGVRERLQAERDVLLHLARRIRARTGKG